jgi:parvulin-like peptidyl-prolyl isomerase
MDMKLLRFLPVALLLAIVLVAAGCGGGSKGVPSTAVARVGNDTITKAQFNDLLAGAQRTYTARKTAFPKAGTTAYKSLQDQAMQYLVQQSELEQKAKELGVTVTDKDVAARLKQIKKQYFSGSEASYQKQLKAQGLTEPQLKQDLHAQILSEKLYNAVTGKLKVSDAEIAKYYNTNKTQYGTAASRDVRHILVNNKKLADTLETQLKNGASFAVLAKKYSKDPGSAKLGGKLTITKGQTVAQFDKVAFSLKTGQTSPPVHTQYGWHIIQALSAVRPAKTTPLASVKAQISQQLLQSKRTAAMTTWLDGVKKDFASKVSYQVGYVPAATTSTSTAPPSTIAGTTTG